MLFPSGCIRRTLKSHICFSEFQTALVGDEAMEFCVVLDAYAQLQ